MNGKLFTDLWIGAALCSLLPPLIGAVPSEMAGPYLGWLAVVLAAVLLILQGIAKLIRDIFILLDKDLGDTAEVQKGESL